MATALWSDVDYAPAKSGGEVGIVSAWDRLADLKLLPSAIVKTGHGEQWWWFLDKPVPFGEAQPFLERLRAFIHANLDDVTDAPRILRVPGSYNCKEGGHLAVKVVYWRPKWLYHLSDFHRLPPVPPAEALKVKAAEKGGRRGGLKRKAPEEVLSGLKGASGQHDLLFKYICGLNTRRFSPEEALVYAERAAAAGTPPYPSGDRATVAEIVGRVYETYPVKDRVDAGDVRLGREFADAFADRVRYCPDLEQWFVWDNCRWAPDATHAAERLMQDLARDRYVAAGGLGDSKDREAEARVWLQAMHRRRIEAALWAARSDPRLVVRLPALDADPWALNCLNGTINLKTGKLLKHNPEELITKLAPVEYDPDADQSEWLKFLERVLPDADMRSFLARATGYSVTGLADEEVLLFVCGPTNGGKSTFVAAVGGALGDYAACASFKTFLRQRHESGPRPDLVRLAGKRFVSSVETEEGAELAGGLLKWLSGQDQVCERTLYKTEVEFLPTFKLWLVSNPRPKAQDDDSALWRRLLLLPFEISIPLRDCDPSVKARLRNPSIGGPAVLAWAVTGCRDWRKHGLAPPRPVTAATRHWRAENDPIVDWLTERMTLDDQDAVTPFKDLAASYRVWAEGNGLKPISGKELARRLQEHGCRPRDGARHQRLYEGIIWRA